MSKSETQSYYDHYWDRGDNATWTPEIKPWADGEFERKLGRFSGKEKVIDVGCGDATTYHRQLLNNVHELYAMDVSSRGVEQAQSVGLKASVVKFDSERFPYEDNSFDGATCIEVLEHLFDPLFTAKEICRVLKPGACLVASVPNFGYFGDRLEALFRARVRNSAYDYINNPFAGAHIRFFSLREFKKLMRAAGFEVVEVIPHSSCSIFDALWVIGRLVGFSMRLKQRVPYVLRLGFLEKVWPSLFAQHIMLVVVKPASTQVKPAP
ncbi:MAG: class I SAM-dependent methyltransferase [Verrucomicrobiota bacterium]